MPQMYLVKKTSWSDPAWNVDSITNPNIPAWPDGPGGGGIPTGLGCLMAGGYLTQKGASVLDCPSRVIPTQGNREPWEQVNTATSAANAWCSEKAC